MEAVVLARRLLLSLLVVILAGSVRAVLVRL